MIAVCQPFSTTGEFHLSFDASVLKAVCVAFPHEQVAYGSDPDNLERMRAALVMRPPNLALYPVGGSTAGRRRLRLHLLLLRNLQKCRAWAENLGARNLLYLAFCTPPCAVHLIRGTSLPEYYIVHNNLQRSRSHLVEGWLFRRIVRDAAALVVLEPPVAQALCAALKVPAAKVSILPHPLPEVGAGRGDPRPAKRFLILPGRVTKAKGLHTLIAAVARLDANHSARLQALDILVAGPNCSGIKLGSCPFIRHLDKTLTDQELQELVGSADFVLLPYDPRHYDYVTPGTLYRAMASGVPVIATELAALRTMLLGDRPVGLPFRGSSGLARRLVQASIMGDDEYQQLRSNVAYHAAQRNIDETAARFRALLAPLDGRARADGSSASRTDAEAHIQAQAQSSCATSSHDSPVASKQWPAS